MSKILQNRLDSIENELQQLENSMGSHLHYRSDMEIFGLPLINIDIGEGSHACQVTKGVIAVGNVAVGAVAVGGVSLGILSFGLISAGIFTYGLRTHSFGQRLRDRIRFLVKPKSKEKQKSPSLHYGGYADDFSPC